MAWIVTSWRIDQLESLVSTEARANATRARRHAARVTERTARERHDLSAELAALEQLGTQLRRQVSEHRGSSEDPVVESPPPLRAVPARTGEGPRPGGRARLEESPLAELFRATAGG